VNSHLRPSHIEINLAALKNNIAVVKSWMGANSRLMAVVKADAYGHGAVKVSEVASQEGVDFLGVAFLEEACELQDAGIKTPIVMLYPESVERDVEAVSRGFHITIADLHQYEEINAIVGHKYPIKYFIKVESGMNRYGMPPDEVKTVVEMRETYPDSQIMGITTNLADAMNRDSILAKKQVDNFMRVMESIKILSQNGFYYSLESSGTLWKNRKAEGTLVRVGHLLYGLVPGGVESDELKPVMTVKSRLAEIHKVSPGEGVGYSFSFVAKRQSEIATIPMGYADGYPWALSNRGIVLVRGERAPVVGRICMDAFMIDITDIPGCVEGDEVVILGPMEQDEIDAHELGRLAGSFSYEILSGWSKRLPRIYL
jgi:alanine racemase